MPRDAGAGVYGGLSYKGRAMALSMLGFANYREYLASPLWRLIRRRVYAAKGDKCHVCKNPATELHHSRYHKNDLSGKRIRFIHPICRECHVAVEFKGKKKCTVIEAREMLRKKTEKWVKEAKARKLARKKLNKAAVRLARSLFGS